MTDKKAVSGAQRRLIPAYIFLIIMSFISVFPFYWMISAATNETLEVARGKLTFGTYAAQNLKNLLAQQDLWGAMKNSVIYATAQTLAALFICSLAGAIVLRTLIIMPLQSLLRKLPGLRLSQQEKLHHG